MESWDVGGGTTNSVAFFKGRFICLWPDWTISVLTIAALRIYISYEWLILGPSECKLTQQYLEEISTTQGKQNCYTFSKISWSSLIYTLLTTHMGVFNWFAVHVVQRYKESEYYPTSSPELKHSILAKTPEVYCFGSVLVKCSASMVEWCFKIFLSKQNQ